MLHQPSTRFAATEPASAEGVSLAPMQAAEAAREYPAAAEEAAADHPWSHPARVATPRAGTTRLFIDCASL